MQNPQQNINKATSAYWVTYINTLKYKSKKKKKENNRKIMSIEAEKTSEKMQYTFMTRRLRN